MMQASDAGLLAVSDRDGPAATAPQAERLARMASENYSFIWRSLRRLGVAQHAVDDAAQQVFVLGALKIAQIAQGSERSFLFQTAVRVAMSLRRNHAQRRESMVGDALEQFADSAPLPDAAAEMRQRRAHLDELLDTLPMDLRTVFVLFEIECLPSPEIASVLEIPVGTVASRLRRAREIFRAEAARLRRRLERRVLR
jgi:RNA polymerase sigma-70 factor (ECF subfamily)